ncbi:MAG TPA: DUF1566 domain-containing protein [bacterium]|jgi:hypothetical protein|nr:DUF1566 domain-containing protein [bacterium]HNW16220.1 DUF1566 domain-containing protein [bacterium]HPA56954.1 DUF1566 domain-containing protein [bacterium]HPG35737.1 DUF1566 domain-containing protein [bacterium]HPM47689.1 DUF1566 domain-containing protein [bacterium]
MKKFIFAVSVLFLAVSCDKGADNVYALEETGGQPVVKGSENGLMWYIDDPDNANTKLNMMTYEKAVKNCSDLEWAGFTDWRLPTIDELRTLVTGFKDVETGGRCKVSLKCLSMACLTQGQKSSADYPCSNYEEEALLQGPGPEGCYFDDVWRTYCGKHWSSSKVAGVVDEMVFILDFSDPAISAVVSNVSNNMGFARCVR